MLHKIYIQRLCMLLFFLLSSVLTYAQLTVKAGDTTELSVNEVSGETYVWELYVVSGNVDFAVTEGNCPKSKAYFIDDKNTGASVNVKWLAEGEYFYKVTARNSCTNNIKIGRVVVGKVNTPPAPKITVEYDCEKGTAKLTASGYTGDLEWSTGENSESIEVSEAGTYTLVQILNGQKSRMVKVDIPKISVTQPTNVAVTPPEIEEGESAELSADAVENTVLHWYANEALSEELDSLVVVPESTTTYWVVAENEIGCRSEAIPVTLIVEQFDRKKCEKLYRNIKIGQFVSPNGDGKNDTWNLEDLLRYCVKCKQKAVIRLFNRWGAKVYETTGKKLKEEPFKGYSNNSLDFRNGSLLPAGTYFYIISINDRKEKEGYIYLVR